MIKPGKMKWQIKLFHRTVTQESSGEPHSTFKDYAEPWAEKIEQRINEIFSGGSNQVSDLVIMRLRYREDIKQDDIFEFRGRDFEVVAINEIGFKDGIDLVGKRLGKNVR
jgi:SPP1 family predicted phage head-tail adaptor